MKKLLVAVLLLALSIPGVASALTYTPTVADMAGWNKLDSTSPSTTFFKESFPGGVKFTGNIYGDPDPGFGLIAIGGASAIQDLSVYSNYALQIYNVNESIWNYTLFVTDSSNFTATSNPVFFPIADKDAAVLSLDLTTSGLDLANITTIGFVISQIVPIPTENPNFPDRTYETIVAPVPEPGTMILLGAGFLGLAIYGKRRKNA